MYQAFYGLNEVPFSIAPNPKYLFLSSQHQQAIAHLQYCLNDGGGFVLLTGEVGTGKTTLARSLLAELPETTDVASILNPTLSEIELLACLCDELKISYSNEPTLKQLTDVLREYLLNNHQQGRNTLLVIDEAQHLRSEVLEQLRLLTNLETDYKKLLQVVLIGQPELQQQLKQAHLRQLAQRITARYHLVPLNKDDVSAYIAHRLSIAGRDSALFSKKSCALIHKLSGGIPRIINLICDKALLHAYGHQLTIIDCPTITLVAKDILIIDNDNETKILMRWPLVASLFSFAIGFSLFYWLSPAPSIAPAVMPMVMSDTPEIDTGSVNFDTQLLPLLSGATLQQTAFSGLMGLWGTERGAGTNPCRSAKQYGLRCMSGTGWGELLDYNHPATISIRYSGQVYHGVLLSVTDNDKVRVQFNQQRLSLDKNWLLAHLTGQFTLLWQPPSDFVSALRMNSQGEAVRVLSSMLNAHYQLPSQNEDVFGRSLETLVKRFQRDNQLSVDGIAGAKTLLKLQVATKQHSHVLKTVATEVNS